MPVAEFEGEQLLVFVVKHVREAGDTPLSQFVLGKVHRNLESLAGVTQVRLEGDLVFFCRNAVCDQRLAGASLEFQQV